MMKKSNIPNFLSCIRIAISVIILTVSSIGFSFYAYFTICVFSDVIDGYLARRFSWQSKLGTRLDSIADFALIAAVFIKLLPLYTPDTAILTWISAIFLIKISAVIIGLFRFHTLYFPHTILNKLTGIALFILVYFIGEMQSVAIIAVCTLASIAATEELLIAATSKSADANRKSLFTD